MDSVIVNSLASQINSPIIARNEFEGILANAEDAISIINKLLSDFSSSAIEKLKIDAESSGGFVNELERSRSLLSSVLLANSRPVQQVTVESLKSAKGNVNLVSEIFHDSSLRLGSSFEESQIMLERLRNIGLTIIADIKVPLLQSHFDKDNKISGESLRFISVDEMEELQNKLNGSPSKDFSGAIEFREQFSGGNYSISTLFINEKNYEISREMFDQSVFSINILISKLNTDFAKSISVISTTLQKIEESKAVIEDLVKNNTSEIRKIIEQKIYDTLFAMEKTRFSLLEIRRRQIPASRDALTKIEDNFIAAGIASNSTDAVFPVEETKNPFLNQKKFVPDDGFKKINKEQ